MSVVKTRNLYNAVVIAIGRRTKYRSNISVPIDEVVNDVLLLSGFGDPEILAYGTSLAQDGEDAMKAGRKDLRRKIHFAHRNQRCSSKGSKATGYSKTPLTVLEKVGHWSLTDFGALLARRMDEGVWQTCPVMVSATGLQGLAGGASS